jgi:phosphonate transport system substrate-binding protein
MGVHPYNSTLALIATHRPLLQYLERGLQRPIEFYTAASFDAYVTALLGGEYDIAIAPPHFGVLAIEKKEYVALVNYQARLEPFLVVRRNSAFQKAQDLAGKRIAMADKTAFIRIAIVRVLADAGLVANRDYLVVERPTHAASIMAVVQGDAEAGLAMGTILKLQPQDVQVQLRPILAGLQFPNLFTLAHRRLGDPLIAHIKALLLGFGNDLEGKAFFEKTGYAGYKDVTPEEIAALQPIVEYTRPLLAPRH